MEIVEKTIDVKVRILPNINTYLVMLVSTVAMANSTPAIIMTKNSTFINIKYIVLSGLTWLIKIYSSMSTLIASDNLKMIKDFFYKEILPFHNSILKDVTFTHSITLIEDSIIQGIIYSYVLKAKNNSINFNIDIQEIINIVSEISSLDMSRILGILLDNAFEEAVKTESKNVILSIIPLKTQIIYVIKNSCNTVPDISKIFLNNYSTKGENHGRGLSIVQNICNNYSNVFFNVKIQDNFFLSELIINTVD